MPDQNDSLFSEEELQREVWKKLSGEGKERLSIAYIGPDLEAGRMDAVVLADGLKGTARFINRIADMHVGTSFGFFVEVEGEPQSGSLEVVIGFSYSALSSLESFGNARLVTALVNIGELAGFGVIAGKSLIWIFKKLRGRPITDESDLDDIFPKDPTIDKAELIRLYNDSDVQAALRAALRPLRKKGIDTYETRVNKKAIETVSKADVEAADAAEMEAIVNDEEKILDVEKASFVPRLAWHLSDHGKPFDAQIEDPILWAQVASGNRFGFGDRLHVTLHTEAERESNGRLKITRTVTKVHTIERANGNQFPLFTNAEGNRRDM